VSGRTFEVRLLRLEDNAVEQGSFELEPSMEQAAAVCRLMRELLSARPSQFRDKVAFLKRGDIELEWNAAEGGVAFATFYEAGEPLTVAALAYESGSEAGRGVREGFFQMLRAKPFDGLPDDSTPLLLIAALPGRPESLPLMQLLNTTLAAVYFTAVSTRTQS
jgi:hypothetical protein